ncbi:MAG: hypothetical protein HRT58_20715 [Crocinitomicaceae bacterium]|nr:hypothetical protein [Flavobacteriales bacterium]NQZ38095.1 hypothetical protein [Crocinitomicaceae bacterium]
MKTNILFLLLLLVGCQAETTDEQTPTISERTNTVNNIQDDEGEIDHHDSPPMDGININQPSWDLVKSAFQKIDSFPIKCSIFPLRAIVIENDTLKMDGDICYSFPEEIASDFVEKHVEVSDSLAIWFEEYGSNSGNWGNGANFDYGIYPFGTFDYASKDYYIYYTLDYLTGRGSYNLSFYIATAINLRWESTFLGKKSYSKFNTYEYIEKEEFFKDRMVSERSLIIELQENKLVITHFEGTYAIDDEFDLFEKGNLTKTTEFILE